MAITAERKRCRQARFGRTIGLRAKLKVTTDTSIRTALKSELAELYGGDPETAIIEEMCVRRGGARIDVALVNGVLHGFELKSDRDSLDRLASQVTAYCSIFDRITLVVGERHLQLGAYLVPDWWGIRVARPMRGSIIFRDLKLPQSNPDVDPVAVAELLWREDALSFLHELGADGGIRTRSKKEICMRLAQCVDIAELRCHVRQSIRARRSGSTSR